MTLEEQEQLIKGQRSMNIKHTTVTVSTGMAILIALAGAVWKANELRHTDLENNRIARENSEDRVMDAMTVKHTELLESINDLKRNQTEANETYRMLVLDATRRISELERVSGDRWTGSMMTEWYLRSQQQGETLDPAVIIDRYNRD